MHDAPLPLCRVLEEEFASIHGGEVEAYDWTIRPQDITDVEGVVTDLQRAWHVDEALRAAFKQTLELRAQATAAELKAIIAGELTKLLDDDALIERLAQALEVTLDPSIQINRLRLEGI